MTGVGTYTSGELVTIMGVFFTGVAGVVAAVFAGMAAIRAGKIVAVAAAIHDDTIAVNHAVNHKTDGMPTLVQRVTAQDDRSIQLAADLATNRDYLNAAVKSLADGIGVQLPESPPPVAPLPSTTPAAPK